MRFNNQVIDFNQIPLKALSLKTIKFLSASLNSLEVNPTEEGLARDWRGLLHCTKINEVFSTELKDPTAKVLSIWSGEKENSASLGKLQEILGYIDRWDIVDNTKLLFHEDAERYLTIETTKKCIKILINTENQNLSDSDLNILTDDDINRAINGQSAQLYHAFLLYVDRDWKYAKNVIKEMEGRGLKLCVHNRDLMAGVPFEHEAVQRLISERCNRLIVIISKAFLQSELNKYLMNYAQAIGIEQNCRKIIPLIFEEFEEPKKVTSSFLLAHPLSFYRHGTLFNFWLKLQQSIECVHSKKKSQKILVNSQYLRQFGGHRFYVNSQILCKFTQNLSKFTQNLNFKFIQNLSKKV